MRVLGVVGVLILGFIVGTAMPTFAVSNNITKEQAAQAAVKAKPGTVSKATLAKLDGQLVWDIRIDKGAVYIDSRTGAIVKTVENVENK